MSGPRVLGFAQDGAGARLPLWCFLAGLLVLSWWSSCGLLVSQWSPSRCRPGRSAVGGNML